MLILHYYGLRAKGQGRTTGPFRLCNHFPKMDFSSASSSSFAANNGTESLAANKEQIMQQVKTEMALAEAQTLLAVS
jgi:hypothetical protein